MLFFNKFEKILTMLRSILKQTNLYNTQIGFYFHQFILFSLANASYK